MKTYTLWLEPTGRTHELLATTIAHLSQEHGGPLFDPHVTLLGDIVGQEERVLQQTEQLANALSPVDLILTVPAFQYQYFQCVFMRIEETSTLLDAHTCARRVFQKEAVRPFMPHVSLLYGLYPTSLKEQIIGALSTSLSVRFSWTWHTTGCRLTLNACASTPGATGQALMEYGWLMICFMICRSSTSLR